MSKKSTARPSRELQRCRNLSGHHLRCRTSLTDAGLFGVGLWTGCQTTKRPHSEGFTSELLERETGFEPATSTLARSHSTTELLPLSSAHYKRPLSDRQTNQGNYVRTDPIFAAPTTTAPQLSDATDTLATAVFMMASPLRILLRRDNLAIAHVDDHVAVFGRLRVVRDHQNRLPEFLIRLSQHP